MCAAGSRGQVQAPRSFYALVRLGALQVDAQEPRKFFLDLVYQLGASQPATEFSRFALELFDSLRSLVSLRLGLGALAHGAWIELALIALLSPGIELRGIDSFAPEKRSDRPGWKRISLAHDAQLIGRGETTSLRFWVEVVVLISVEIVPFEDCICCSLSRPRMFCIVSEVFHTIPVIHSPTAPTNVVQKNFLRYRYHSILTRGGLDEL